MDTFAPNLFNSSFGFCGVSIFHRLDLIPRPKGSMNTWYQGGRLVIPRIDGEDIHCETSKVS